MSEPRGAVLEYGHVFADASIAATKLGVALAEFENAVDRLAAATPHCETCGWATGRGHRKHCSAGDPS